ncbi:maleylpyruvate isomerase family mycothiol-dependent enzyme [Sphaerisporangium fuscum]|uniref:maleylpyruvate isomerase family mycothiol-dependent enzyme n=1 Tax=Sphaerisporangium fuscum TaxID=2835868 RepID=UPI001BDD244E|nr:maleylpyruvate isomerase family mycothiol-dependent enzyme [Sphaerisporangium fuscum]
MNPDAYLLHLRRELDAFRTCLDGDLSAPVVHCGDWTLRDLAGHLGGGNLWAARAVTERRGDYQRPEPPQDGAELRRWYEEAAETLLDALDTDPSTEAWTFWPPHTVGFWQRRRCQETLIHLWDAENALGEPRPFDLELAADGVAEVFDTMAPRQVARGRSAPPAHAIRLHATDAGTSWTYGPGDPVAEIEATAETLLLMLWGRIPSTDPEIAWSGDQEAAQKTLNGPLTP